MAWLPALLLLVGGTLSKSAMAIRSGNSTKQGMMRTVDVYHMMMCWGKQEKFNSNEECLDWMVKQCKVASTSQGYCQKLSDLVVKDCDSGKAPACARAVQLGLRHSDKAGNQASKHDNSKTANAVRGLKAKTETKAKVAAKVETKTKVAAKAETKAKVAAKAETKAKVAAKAETKTKVAAKAETKAKVTAKAETKAKALAPAPAPGATPAASPGAAPAPAPVASPAGSPAAPAPHTGISKSVGGAVNGVPPQGYNEYSEDQAITIDDLGTKAVADWQKEWPQSRQSEEETLDEICEKNHSHPWCQMKKKRAQIKYWATRPKPKENSFS